MTKIVTIFISFIFSFSVWSLSSHQVLEKYIETPLNEIPSEYLDSTKVIGGETEATEPIMGMQWKYTDKGVCGLFSTQGSFIKYGTAFSIGNCRGGIEHFMFMEKGSDEYKCAYFSAAGYAYIIENGLGLCVRGGKVKVLKTFRKSEQGECGFWRQRTGLITYFRPQKFVVVDDFHCAGSK